MWYTREHKAARRYMALLLALALLTSLFVNWQLHSVGIAQTADYQCGEIEHQHTAECYEKVLVCGYEEGEPEDWNATKPDDSAFLDADYGVEQSEADIAAYSAEPEPEYIFVPHQHTDDCYQEVKTLTCHEEEHVHTDDCFDPEDGSLICDLFEHTHDDSCYSIEYELVCGLEEGELVEGPNPDYVPVDEEAFAVFDDAVALQPIVDDSSLDTPVHHHTDACYEEVLVCGLPEHHHTVNCLSDPLADVEDEETWSAKTNVVLTGAWADDLTAVAKSQLGYQQSERNFQLDDEDQTTVRHYTRYGAWYGNAYGAWDVMFLSYCLNYADVPLTTVPQRAGVQALRSDLRGSEWLKAAAEVELVPGDIVFYNSITTETVAVEEDAPQIMNDSADADIALLSLEPAAAEPQTEERTVSTKTVGIVSDVEADTGTLTVISGDVDGKVAEVSLRADEITDVIDLAAAHKAQEEHPAAGGISHEELGEQESALVIWPISEEELAQYPMMLSAELDETDAAGNQALTVTKVTFQRREGNTWPDIQEGTTVKEDDEIRMYVDFTLAPNTFTQLPGTVYYQLPGGLKLKEPITNGVIRNPSNVMNDQKGEPVGSYTIDKDGKVALTFEKDKINPQHAFNGTLMFTARANYSSSKNGEITFGNNIKLQIQKPDPDLGDITKGFAEKVMWSDEEGNFYIHWKVTVPTKNGSGGPVDIRDVLTQGYLPSSFDPDNSNGPVSITRYDAAGTKKPLTTDEYSGTYKIDGNEPWTFHNDAELIQGGSEVSAPATDTRHGDSIFTKEVSTDGQNYAQNIPPVDYDVNADHRLYYKITLVTTADSKGTIGFSDNLPKNTTFTATQQYNRLLINGVQNAWGGSGNQWQLGYNSTDHTVSITVSKLVSGKEYKIEYLYSVAFDTDPGWDDLLTAERKYENTASWGPSGNKKTATTTTTVTRKVEPLTKTGEQQKNSGEWSNCITYTVIINPEGVILGDGETLDLKDVMTVDTSSGASFYGSNVKLYYYDHGKSVSEMKPVPPSQYTNLKPEGNEWLHMTVPDHTALLQYDCIIANNRNEPMLSNTVSLNTYKKEQKLRFHTNDSSVTVSSGQLVIKKVDGTTLNPLQGAAFTLTPYGPSTKQFNEAASLSGTTNASGELVFHITDNAVLPHVLYRLQETSAPAGYIKDSTPRYVFFYENGKEGGKTPVEVYQQCIGTDPVQDGETAVQAENVTFGTTTSATTLTVKNTYNRLTVTKTWLNASNNQTTDEDDIPQKSIQVQLYRRKAGQTTADKVGEPVVLSKDTNWSHTWEGEGIPAVDSDGQKWYYSVQELDTGLWKTTYSANNEDGIQTGSIYITNTIYSSYVLPSTGGMGTVPFAAVGGMLTVGAALLLAKRKKHEEKGE